jgi:CRISPR-associated protein Cst2
MQNPGFLTVAAKLIANVHAMNNEGSIGQTTDIRMIRMVGEDGKELGEVPAVSGRMLKHWHLAYMLKEELNQNSSKLCEKCKEWKPDRQSDAKDESSGVNNCIVCDAHGFLSTAKVQAPPRRSSCISFSWLLPVIGSDSPSKQVIHSRVEPSGSIEEETTSAEETGEESSTNEIAEEEVKRRTAQMIFYKNYASSIYAFICSMDLDRIGKPLNGKIDFNDTGAEVKRRRQMAVKALMPMVMGAFGASQSHALPHTRCLGVLAALSNNTTPLPNLVSPIYSKGFEESINMLKAFNNNTVKYWGYGEPAVTGATKQGNLQALFNSILTELQ